mgnify:CR=1 FL=1|jgi:L-fuculose-phosphate aldolase
MNFEAAREQVVHTCIELADRGYLAGTGGNVAIRVDAEHFAVTPSALDYYAMTPDDVCIVRLSDGVQVEGARQASVESGLHAAVLRARPDSGACIHTHQPVASAYSLLGRPLVVCDEARRQVLGERVPYVEYAPSGTAWLAMRVAAVFEHGDRACVMRNHGIVCVGIDTAEAAQRVRSLEAECATQLLESLGEALPKATTAPVRTLLEESLRNHEEPDE